MGSHFGLGEFTTYFSGWIGSRSLGENLAFEKPMAMWQEEGNALFKAGDFVKARVVLLLQLHSTAWDQQSVHVLVHVLVCVCVCECVCACVC